MCRSAVAILAIFFGGWGGHAFAAVDLSKDGPLHVQGTGVALGLGAAGRIAAIANAERNAVAQVLEDIVASRDLRLFGSMIDAPGRYVLSYNLLTHEETGDSTRVSLEVELNRDLFCADAAALLSPTLARQPRLIVLMGEKGQEGASEVAIPKEGLAENTLCEAFQGNRLVATGTRDLLARYSEADLVSRLNADAPMVARLALENLADLVVIGTLYATVQPGPTNTQACQVRLSVKLLRGADAAVLLDRSVDAIVHSVDIEEGRSQAVLDACAKVMPQLFAMALVGVAGKRDTKVTFTVLDVGTQERAKSVQDYLTAFLGVRSVELIYYAPSLARFRIDGDFALSDLVDDLALHTFASFYLEHKSAVDREVEMRLVAQ